jgi:DNA-binding NarL/FixJ family response regulator
MPCRVLIVDDHATFRAAARTLLEEGGLEVVGEAADGTSALAAVARLRPDLVLLDIQLPDIDGFAVAERLAASQNAPAIVLTSSRAIASYRRRLAANPALRFVAKGDISADVLAGAVSS